MVVIINRNIGETIQFTATGVLIRRGKHYEKTETQGEGHLMTEAEIRVMKLQAKERQRLMASPGKGKEGSV